MLVKWESDGCKDGKYSYEYEGPCCDDCEEEEEDPNPIKTCRTSADCIGNETNTRCCGGPDGRCFSFMALCPEIAPFWVVSVIKE